MSFILQLNTEKQKTLFIVSLKHNYKLCLHISAKDALSYYRSYHISVQSVWSVISNVYQKEATVKSLQLNKNALQSTCAKCVVGFP